MASLCGAIRFGYERKLVKKIIVLLIVIAVGVLIARQVSNSHHD
jgi:hypothetical protein